MVRLRCKNCHKRVTIKPIYSRDNRWVLFRCPNFRCNAEGVFKNKNYVPFLFVHKIKLVSRQYFSVLNPSRLRLSDVGFCVKPPTINANSPRRQNNRNIIKGVL